MKMDRNTSWDAEERKEDRKRMEAGEEFLEESVYGDDTSHDYWQRFLQTGKISDYLSYAAVYRADGPEHR